MLRGGDVRVCLSALDITITYREGNSYQFCPSCGIFDDLSPASEVRISSLLVIFGVGSYLCYKYLSSKTKMAPSNAKVSSSSRTKVDSGATAITPTLRLSPLNETLFNQTLFNQTLFNQTLFNQTPIGILDAAQSSSSSNEDAMNAESEPSPLRQWKRNIKKAKWSASTPYSVPETPPDSDVQNSDLPDSDVQNSDLPDSDVHSVDGNESYLGTPNMASSLLKSSFSLSSLSGSVFGDGTVFKLDQLLNQIEDIKKSVVEMDADLFSVEKSKKCIKKFLTIGANDESGDGISLPETNTTSPSPTLGWNTTSPPSPTLEWNTTSPPSPTLEWDSDDINTHFLSYFSDDQEAVTDSLPVAVEMSTLELQRLELQRLELQRLELQRLELPLSRASSSGKGSSVASPVGEDGTDGGRSGVSLGNEISFKNHQLKDDTSLKNHQLEDDTSFRNHQLKDDTSFRNHQLKDDTSLRNHQLKDDTSFRNHQLEGMVGRLKGMIEEANELGLVNELLKELMRFRQLKRDSAYFEDED